MNIYYSIKKDYKYLCQIGNGPVYQKLDIIEHFRNGPTYSLSRGSGCKGVIHTMAGVVQSVPRAAQESRLDSCIEIRPNGSCFQNYTITSGTIVDEKNISSHYPIYCSLKRDDGKIQFNIISYNLDGLCVTPDTPPYVSCTYKQKRETFRQYLPWSSTDTKDPAAITVGDVDHKDEKINYSKPTLNVVPLKYNEHGSMTKMYDLLYQFRLLFDNVDRKGLSAEEIISRKVEHGNITRGSIILCQEIVMKIYSGSKCYRDVAGIILDELKMYNQNLEMILDTSTGGFIYDAAYWQLLEEIPILRNNDDNPHDGIKKFSNAYILKAITTGDHICIVNIHLQSIWKDSKARDLAHIEEMTHIIASLVRANILNNDDFEFDFDQDISGVIPTNNTPKKYNNISVFLIGDYNNHENKISTVMNGITNVIFQNSEKKTGAEVPSAWGEKSI
jgi:hypothetical protein